LCARAQAYVLFYLRQSPEKEYERKQLLSAIAAFHEEEEREHAVVASDGDCSDDVLENGSAADPMHIEKNGTPPAPCARDVSCCVAYDVT
jgi:hypothetical protein